MEFTKGKKKNKLDKIKFYNLFKSKVFEKRIFFVIFNGHRSQMLPYIPQIHR